MPAKTRAAEASARYSCGNPSGLNYFTVSLRLACILRFPDYGTSGNSCVHSKRYVLVIVLPIHKSCQPFRQQHPARCSDEGADRQSEGHIARLRILGLYDARTARCLQDRETGLGR
jgi:hypothetical protein